MDIPVISPADNSTGTVNGLDRTSTQHAALFDEWDLWSKQAPAGNSEMRDTAVSRLKDCLERGADSLDLIGLNLSSLPDNLPSGLTRFETSDNPLSLLPENLPPGLQELYADNTYLTRLPTNLPPDLKVLYIIGNKLSGLPDNLPSGLITLHMDNIPWNRQPESRLEQVHTLSPVTDLPDNLPAGLQTLKVDNTLTESLPFQLSTALKSMNPGQMIPGNGVGQTNGEVPGLSIVEGIPGTAEGNKVDGGATSPTETQDNTKTPAGIEPSISSDSSSMSDSSNPEMDTAG